MIESEKRALAGDGTAEFEDQPLGDVKVGEVLEAETTAAASTNGVAVVEEMPVSAKVEPVDPPHWKVNLTLLVLAWFLGYTVQFAHVSSSVAIAREMAGDNLATLPNSLIFVGALITTMPLSIMGEKYGLRISYVFGTGMGLTGGTLCLLAMYFWSFPLLCFGLLLQGSQQATTSLVRFGVRSVVPARYMSKALSWVVAGAAIAAPVGPLIGANTIYMIPAHKYMGVYIIILCLIAAMTVVTSLLRFPPLPPKKATDEPDQARWPIIREFLRSKKFMIALIAGSVSYALMVLMMAPAPLAILGAGFSFADQSYTIMAHILGMFVPSIFTGVGFTQLIEKFGSVTMNIVGLVILTAAIGILFGGKIMPIFYVGETLVGIGWNFSYIAASTIILKGAKPGRELQTIQGANDTFLQLLSGVVTVVSGPLYRAIDWLPLAGLALCIMGLAAVLILAIARLPLRGMRDDGIGLKGWKKQKDEEVEMGIKPAENK